MSLKEIVLEQEYYGQQIINRWNYLEGGIGASVSGSFALAYAFGAIPTGGVYNPNSILGTMAALQSEDVSFRQLVVKDVYDPVDFYEVPFLEPLNGGVVGTGSSPFLAFGFRSNRTRTDIRRGQKRLVGVREEDMLDGGELDGGKLNGLAGLATKWGEILEYDDEGSIMTFSPVIVSKEKLPLPDTDPVRYTYKYYEDEATQLQNLMAGITWTPYTQVRSQTSRQYGRGR